MTLNDDRELATTIEQALQALRIAGENRNVQSEIAQLRRPEPPTTRDGACRLIHDASPP